MSLNPTIPKIRQTNSAIQKQLANEMKTRMEKLLNKSFDEGVSLEDIEEIEDNLKINIQVFTLMEIKNNSKEEEKETEENSDPTIKTLYDNHFKNFPQTVYLDYNENIGHFSLIKSIGGYGSYNTCSYCGRVFHFKHSTKFNKHIKQHEKNEGETIQKRGKFEEKIIKYKPKMYELILNVLLHLPGFIGFDFECILRPENDPESTIIATHIPVGVVAKFYPSHQKVNLNYFKRLYLDMI